MKESESNICQIAAIKEGRLVLSESYHGYSKDDCCHIASATKSFTGLSWRTKSAESANYAFRKGCTTGKESFPSNGLKR